MESPFFRNHWNYHPQPQRPRYVPPSMMEIPAHRRTVPVAPKVVSIPVRFVEPKRSRSDSATKLQKVFRGFLVRKSLKKVLAIEGEVNEIVRRLANEETVELIRRDTKERVRFGEMLMNLLFRLDSVKGVDSGIRNFRKAVIKKAIALQEKVDSIAAADNTPEADIAECDSEAVDRSSEMNVSLAVEETPELKDGILEHDDDKIVSADDCNEELENVAIIEESTPNVNLEVPVADGELKTQISEPGKDELVETVAEAELKAPEEVDNDMVHREIEDPMSESKSQTDSSNNPPNSDNEEDPIEEEDSRMKGRDEDGQSRDLLEKMMVENKRMMEMMGQLYEKNEMQSQLLCSLSHRVEQLEKALVYEMLRKKKKRNCVDCLEKCPKTKKSGK